MIHWRFAESDIDARALAPLLLIDQYREVGRARLDPDKAFISIYTRVKEKRACMIFDGETLVGSVGLMKTDYWYSDDPQLVEQWAYVDRRYRGGEAMRCIFDFARHVAERDGFPAVHMIVFNPQRAKARSPIAHYGEQFGFRPAGAVITIEAAE